MPERAGCPHARRRSSRNLSSQMGQFRQVYSAGWGTGWLVQDCACMTGGCGRRPNRSGWAFQAAVRVLPGPVDRASAAEVDRGRGVPGDGGMPVNVVALVEETGAELPGIGERGERRRELGQVLQGLNCASEYGLSLLTRGRECEPGDPSPFTECGKAAISGLRQPRMATVPTALRLAETRDHRVGRMPDRLRSSRCVTWAGHIGSTQIVNDMTGGERRI